MEFKKILQKFFKKTFQKFFKLIYGKIELKVDLNELKNLSKKKILKIKPDLNTSSDYYIYKILDGRIYTDNVENVAVISENYLLNKISYQQVLGELKDASENVVLYKGTSRFKKKYNGRVLSLLQGASGNNYSHWILEMLPKIRMYSEHYSLDDLNYVYIPKINSFQKETLSVFGINEKQLIDSEKFRHIEAKELIVVDHPYYYGGSIIEQNKYLPKWTIEWLRETYLNCQKKFNANKRVFIDRSDSKYKHNQIINKIEVSNYLKSNNFTSYRLKELSFFEKIYLFKNADIILGVHGAGFANLAFCKPKTKVLEIRPYSYSNSIYEKISIINDLNHHLIQIESLKDNKKTNGDIYISLENLNNTLKEMLNK